MLDRAGELGRVLVSQDTDLLIIAADRQGRGEAFAGVLYAPQNRANVGCYVEDLTLISELEEPEDYQNIVRYLPL